MKNYIKKALISMKDYISDDTFFNFREHGFTLEQQRNFRFFIEFKLKKTGIEYGFSSERISQVRMIKESLRSIIIAYQSNLG